MKMALKLMVVVLFLASGSVFAQQGKAKVEFKETNHDFGTFKEEGGIQSYTFKFKNTGSEPLILNNVQPSCGCTTPEWIRQPVAPGTEGFIKVSYDPTGRPGSFNKSVQVISNAENSNVVLYIQGNVTPREKTVADLYPITIGPLRAKTNNVSFTQIFENQAKSDELELINTTDKDVTIAIKNTPPHITAVMSKAVLKPQEKGTLKVTYDAAKNKTFGFVMESIYLDIDGKSDYQNRIGISASIEEDFSKLSEVDRKNAPVVSYDNKEFDFGSVDQGGNVEHTFMLKNVGKRDLIIRKVSTTCGCTAVTPEKTVVAANESVPLKVVFNSTGKQGLQNKTITVITNDPQNPTSMLRITGNVVVKQ